MALGKKMDDVEEELFSDVRVNKQPDPRKEVGLLSRKEKQHRDEEEEDEPRRHYRTEADSDGQRQITIRVSPKAIERTVFVAIILVLAGLVVYNPFYQSFPWYNEGNQITGAAIASGGENDQEAEQEKKTLATDEERSSNKDGKDDTEKEDTGTSLDNESSDDEATEFSGDRTITIDDYKYAIKEWGVKMTSVSFTIENHGEPFVPKVRAYVFDKETRETYERTPEVKVYAELGKDKRLKATIDIAKFSFQDKESEKTIRLKLYDEGEEAGFAHDKHVATVDKVFTAS